MPIGPRVFF